jgi:rubrerythrin
MDIYEFAMKMEKDGESFYRETAAGCGIPGVATILNLIADEEVKHYELFERLSRGQDPALAESGLLEGTKNVFQEMRDGPGDFKLDLSQVELYKQAQEIEKKSETFYRDRAAETEVVAQRKLFETIADEERRHYLIVGRIIEFVNRPSQWLENAEWHHLDEY